MNPSDALAQHRIARAHGALQEADLLIEQQHFSGALNRVYYAAFYAARALLATRNLDSSRHSGVIALFTDAMPQLCGAGERLLANLMPLLTAGRPNRPLGSPDVGGPSVPRPCPDCDGSGRGFSVEGPRGSFSPGEGSALERRARRLRAVALPPRAPARRSC